MEGRGGEEAGLTAQQGGLGEDPGETISWESAGGRQMHAVEWGTWSAETRVPSGLDYYYEVETAWQGGGR